MRYVTFDTETTGFTPKNGDRVVEVAAVLCEDGKEIDRFQSLIWPERNVPARAAQVHGLTTQKLRGAPLFKTIARDFADFLAQDPSWAHNAPFDIRFLTYEFEKAGVTWENTTQCSLKLAKSCVPGPHKLVDLAARAGWTWENRGAHSAIEDSRALGSVMMMLWEAKGIAPKPAPSTNTATPFVPTFTDDMDSRLLEEAGNFTSHNRGKPWNKAQDDQLKAAWSAGKGLATLCPLMGRSPAAIALRLESLNLITTHPYTGFRRK